MDEVVDLNEKLNDNRLLYGRLILQTWDQNVGKTPMQASGILKKFTVPTEVQKGGPLVWLPRELLITDSFYNYCETRDRCEVHTRHGKVLDYNKSQIGWSQVSDELFGYEDLQSKTFFIRNANGETVFQYEQKISEKAEFGISGNYFSLSVYDPVAEVTKTQLFTGSGQRIFEHQARGSSFFSLSIL